MNNNNTLGMISMIGGIVSLLLAVLGMILGFFNIGGGICGLFAILIGAVSVVLAASSKKNGGNGTAGLVMGIIAIALGVIVGICCIICKCAHYYDAVDYATSIYSSLY